MFDPNTEDEETRPSYLHSDSTKPSGTNQCNNRL
jgi:hypothetical protein